MVLNPHQWGFHKVFQRCIPKKRRNQLQQWFDRHHIEALQNATSIMEIRQIAKQRAHRMIFDYMDGGADDEVTLRRNQEAFSDYEFRRKTLDDDDSPLSLTDISLSTTLFSHHVDLPFFACPTAGNKMFHVQGEAAVAQVAKERSTVYTMSSLSTTSFHDICQMLPASSNKVPKVFQLYVWKDRALVKDLLHQAKRDHGFTGLALTVDATWMGNRERDIRNGFSIPPDYGMQQTIQAMRAPAWTLDFVTHDPYKYACINQDVPAESLVSFIHRQLTPDFGWQDAEWVLGEWVGGGNGTDSDTFTAALKGVVRPEDAVHAAQMGFDTVWISNHGGRQLDTAPATVDVLSQIKEALAKIQRSHVVIVLDGGIQCGADIAKALALGANGVGIGKPYLWGLCAGGYEGVQKVFEILETQLRACMAELGVAGIDELKELGASKQCKGS
jgi:isopentenyl diphosphate isomerase/L-lactate dehydrogenase-like FMN-dependent dehydrogenase